MLQWSIDTKNLNTFFLYIRFPFSFNICRILFSIPKRLSFEQTYNPDVVYIRVELLPDRYCSLHERLLYPWICLPESHATQLVGIFSTSSYWHQWTGKDTIKKLNLWQKMEKSILTFFVFMYQSFQLSFILSKYFCD